MISPRTWFELVMKEAIKKSASLKDVTWHIFRQTHISRLVMAGVDPRTVQELAGHKDIKRQGQEKAEARETTRLSLVPA